MADSNESGTLLSIPAARPSGTLLETPPVAGPVKMRPVFCVLTIVAAASE
jgi:hypothetical protein